MESLIGKTIDGYKILEVLGRGGMGVVFKAMDVSLDKIIALKMIDPFLARDENFVKRFKTEAKALARLENPNIVRVHALRKTEFGFFMVMEYVDAKPLSHWIQEKGSFALKDTISITKQLLSVFDHAHKAGVIHRDIKPSNIMLSDDGTIKVLDFGLAKVIRKHGAASTVTQTRAGSLYYMSPEQIKGLKNVDKRSDLYSIGMTIYEMVAGRTPFDKTDSDFTIQKRIVDGDIPSPIKFGSNIPRQFVKMILKAINKEPDKRFQTADEMLEAAIKFEKHISPEPKTKLPSVGKKPFYKQPVFFTSILAFILVLVLLKMIFMPSNNSTIDLAKLSITTEPEGAEIVIGEDSIGNSPIDGYSIKAEGDIEIQIKKEGYATIDTVITIEFGQVISSNFNLTTVDIEQITISSQPAGAKIFIDEKYIGYTPLEKDSMAAGQLSLHIEKIGYVRKDTFVVVKQGVPNYFNFVLNNIPSSTKSGGVRVTSTPNGASVYLNQEFVGTTPYETGLESGTYEVLIRKKGYADYRESVNVRDNKTIKVTKTLGLVGHLSITTQPSGAEIILDDQSVGNTPYSNRQIKLGEHKITLRKEGYKLLTIPVTVEHNKEEVVDETLAQLMGKVEILLRPFGSIFIDGDLKISDTSTPYKLDLPGGKHNIKAVHPSLGNWEKVIEITDEESQKFVLDFNRKFKLLIVSDPSNCKIFVDGKSINKNTPKPLKLNAGNHTIQVKKKGYQDSNIESYDVPYDLYEGQNDLEGRVEFKLTKIE